MNIFVWVDDVRPCPVSRANCAFPIIECKSYRQAIHHLKNLLEDYQICWIDLDHDLGEGKTGYDIAKWIVENEIPQPLIRWRCHSSNPVGQQNIRQLLTHYGYEVFA